MNPEGEAFEDAGRGTPIGTWTLGLHPELMEQSWSPSLEGVLVALPLGFVTGHAGW